MASALCVGARGESLKGTASLRQSCEVIVRSAVIWHGLHSVLCWAVLQKHSSFVAERFSWFSRMFCCGGSLHLPQQKRLCLLPLPPKTGDKRNAIPREASADILVPPSQLVAARAAVASCLSQLQQVYGSVEADLALSLTEHQQQQQQHGSSEGAAVTRVISPAGTTTIIDVLSSLPHGPVRMSPAMPGLVETSNNLASIKLLPPTDSGKASYSIIVTTRSSLPPALANERSRIAAVAKLAGAKVEQPADYAGCEFWEKGDYLWVGGVVVGAGRPAGAVWTPAAAKFVGDKPLYVLRAANCLDTWTWTARHDAWATGCLHWS